MENQLKAKNTFKLTPCGPQDPCFDYDVCGSDDDITDKDLADLLKEETNKLQDENDNNEQQDKEKKDDQKNKDEQKDKNKDKDLEENKETSTKSKAYECPQTKKRPCKKVVKNPFFTNRLTFSSDMPPRPAVPPPQFFPLALENEAKVCSKKKKCKKKEGSKTRFQDGGEKGSRRAGGADDKDGEEKGKEGEEGEDGRNLYDCVASCPIEETCECPEKQEIQTQRDRCKKDIALKKGPCRKKSDVSIPPQPRRIPALLKDLPLTCPNDIPEVERQIRMSRDIGMERKERNSCKKKCKKREQIEKLL